MEGFLIFEGRDGIGDDAATKRQSTAAVSDSHRSDGDIKIKRSVPGEVSDSAGVDSSWALLKGVDDLHRAQLGASCDGSSWEACAQQIDRMLLFVRDGLDDGVEVVDGGVGFADAELPSIDTT